MTVFIIVAACAVVAIILYLLAIGFAEEMGRRQAIESAQAKRAEDDARRAKKAAQVLADRRTDDDTAERLRNHTF